MSDTPPAAMPQALAAAPGELPEDDGRTILLARPGAPATASAAVAEAGSASRFTTATGASATTPPPVRPAVAPIDFSAMPRHGLGLNPLVRAANPLLALVVPLRYLTRAPDLGELRQNLVRAIKNFEAEARQANLDPQAIAVARYALCTFLDETIASTPWGGGAWAGRSLLVDFHNEAWGGEKFFQILQRLAQEPARHLQLLELMYLCLALGLEGRYRVREDGRNQVEGLRERLHRMIRAQREAYAPALSLRWEPSTGDSNTLLKGFPIWAVVVCVAAFTLAIRMGLMAALNAESDPLLDRFSALRLHAAPPVPQAAAPVALPAPPVPEALPPPSLASFLAPEIAYGLLTVEEDAGEIRITLRGEGMFDSGSSKLQGRVVPLLARIGVALKTVPGTVLVLGHTDDQISSTPGFPSNELLSQARADAVLAQLLEVQGATDAAAASRFSAEGRGARAPLVANTNAAARARNRRVELVVVKPVVVKPESQE